MFDVAVAGLGAMGSAIAARLALDGVRTIGFEQFARGHTLGSFAGETRIIRQAYYEDPAYVPLLLRAYDLWNDLERRTGRRLRRTSGVLMCGAPESDVIEGSLHAARAHELDVETLDAADVRRRFPRFAIADGEVAVFEPAGGVLFSEHAIAAQLEVAERHGATLRFETRLRGWESDGKRVTIDLAGSRVEAETLVLCAGAWLEPEFARIGIELEIQRNVQVWFEAAGAPTEEAFPAYLVDRSSLRAPLYGFPDFGSGCKAALHGAGARTSADALDRTIDARTDVEPVRAALAAWLPAVTRPLRAMACLYSLAPDRNFVVDRHPRYENVVLCGGFSGHGFKFASVVGEIVTDLARGKAARHDIAFLRANRFGTSSR